MRREGRIHGSYVRMKKDEPFEYNKGAPRRPTNHSRVTASCLQNKGRCCYCHDRPVLKAMCKTKGTYKQKGLDVTRNHRLDEFSLGCSPSSLGFEDYYEDSGEILRNIDDSDYDDDREETPNQSENHRSSEIIFSLASFLRGAHEVTEDAGTPESISEGETFDETLQHGISNRQIETETQSDCSWSGVDVSDSEDGGVDLDGWYLVG